MALEAGTRIGAYEILAPLGTGGMSEVYRARDLTLGREVALKLLPEGFSRDRDRVARFEREAQLLASLQHPNIAVIHGLERDGTRSFLVLELLSGESLAKRLERGPLSIDEARRIFIQIALALEAAHGKGVVHRDLKPANAQITEGGTVKLLDFGLGKDVRLYPPASKTVTYDGSVTDPGLLLGTPSYMSPEQARGRTVGKTTDVWSFGVCLFEALSGRSPFARDTLSDTLSAILNQEPPWSALPRGVPRGFDVLLKRCLRKDERQRLHDIADARIELEETSTALGRAPALPLWALALAAAVLFGGISFLVRTWSDGGSSSGLVRRFVIGLPPTAPMSLANGGALAVSPDGGRLVYSAGPAGRNQLYLRSLAQLDAAPVAGTDGAASPVFSPSGDAIAFVAEGKLKWLALPGGSAVTLADAPSPRGIAWVPRGAGSILFSPTSGGGLDLVPARGGAAKTVTALGEVKDHRWPAALPDGEGALVTLWREKGFDVGVVDLGSGRISSLVENASHARYVATGHLVFARAGRLYAARFDARSRRLISEPVAVVENVAHDRRTGAAFFDVSRDGDLFYVSGDAFEAPAPGQATALLVDGRGIAQPIGPPRPSLQVPRLSPDGRTLLAAVTEGRRTDLWTFDLERGAATRLTLTGDNGAGVFSPDGRRIAFASARDGAFSIYWTLADGSGGLERIDRTDGTGHPRFPTSFSPDGKHLVYAELHPETSFDIHYLALETGRSRPLAATRFEEAGGVVSPDGRFLAYTSTETGREEIYVRRFPGPEGRWQISSDSGSEPVWSRDGTKLFFRSGSSLLAVLVRTEPDFESSKPRVLFEAPFDAAGALYANYDATRDGENFVMIRTEQEPTAAAIHVVLNWFEELRERVR